MRPGHVPLLPLWMLFLISRKPCFTDMVATAVQSLGPPVWWVWGAGTQGVPWHIQEPSQERNLFENKKVGKIYILFSPYETETRNCFIHLSSVQRAWLWFEVKKKALHDKIMRVHNTANVRMSKQMWHDYISMVFCCSSQDVKSSILSGTRLSVACFHVELHNQWTKRCPKHVTYRRGMC